MLEHEAGEIAMKAFVARDQLVAERQTRHESSLLHPEDGGERAREEDALDGGESDDAFGVGGVVSVDP